MKKENVIHDLKSAAVVVTAGLTMNACADVDKPLTAKQLQVVERKTDSAKLKHSEYIMASGLFDLCEARTKQYKEDNIRLVKKYSKEYITKQIQDFYLRKMMLDAVQNDDIGFVFYENGIESDTVNENSTYPINEQRWFKDLMLYLTNNYTDRQLLNSDFFKVINDPKLKRVFEYNTNQIEALKESIDFTSKRKVAIRNELWNKYAEEEKHSKQR